MPWAAVIRIDRVVTYEAAHPRCPAGHMGPPGSRIWWLNSPRSASVIRTARPCVNSAYPTPSPTVTTAKSRTPRASPNHW